MKDFLNELKKRAIAADGSIVFPESGDERVLQAAMRLADEKIAKVILIGEPETVKAELNKLNPQFEADTLQIIRPADHPRINEFADFYYEKRKKKGVTPEMAAETVLNELFFGALLVQFGFADAMIAGAVNTTGDVLKSALQVIGVKAGLQNRFQHLYHGDPKLQGQDRLPQLCGLRCGAGSHTGTTGRYRHQYRRHT